MVVPGTTVLVPGTPFYPSFPLARYRFPELEGAVRAFVRSTTRPEDLVLAIGTVSGKAVSEVVAEQRRIVALGRNPVDLLCANLSLFPVGTANVQAALTLLGDQPKADRPLILHIKSQYSSRCPNCQRPGTAEWFAWDRDRGRPFAKRVVCGHCDQVHEGPVDAEDLKLAGEYPVTSGPAYYLALNRAAGQDAQDLSRIAQLIQLYTPRNLSVLMDLIYRAPQLHLDSDALRVTHALLLEALDRGSALAPYEAPESRPRSLRVPQRFLERNVWMVLEQAVTAYRDLRHVDVPSDATPDRGRHDLRSFLVHPEQRHILINRSVQSLNGHGLESRFQGMLVHLVPPEATSWALNVLWSLWLWGEGVPEDLRSFLQRRRLDWDWYQRSLAAALRYARPFLAPGARILMMAPAAEVNAARAMAYAASQDGLAIERWVVCPPTGSRALLRDPSHSGSHGAVDGVDVPSDDAEVAVQILQARGEPTSRQVLEASAILHARRSDLQDLRTGATGPLEALAESTLWLRAPSDPETPLADRLETMVVDLLSSVPHWTREDLVAEIYGVFQGVLSAEPEIVQAVIEAYALEDADTGLRLRPEDDPQRRRKELQQLRKAVVTLGERLGYSPVRRLNGDLVWREERTQSYLFRVTDDAMLGKHLLQPPPRCDGRRCLVLPGGRSALVALKLRRDPRLTSLADAHNWTFIKFRHLRRMIDEIADRAEIEVFLGLDPIVEKPGAQIPLPLHVTARR